MSEQTGVPVPLESTGPLRTLAIRITDGLRSQLEMFSRLNDRTLTEEIRIALETWVKDRKSDPALLKRADAVRAEIEREAEAKRTALTAIFGDAKSAPAAPRGRGKPSGGAA